MASDGSGTVAMLIIVGVLIWNGGYPQNPLAQLTTRAVAEQIER